MRHKVLIALFRLPYPATDGTRYKILNNVAQGLMRDFDVEFLVVNIKSYDQTDVEYLEKNFGKVHLFHHSKIAYLCNSFPAIFSGLPLQAQAFRFSDAQAWLDVHIDDYTAVYVHEIRMTELFIRYSDEQKKKFLVDFNDAISMNYREGVRKMGFFKRLFYGWEGKRVAAYESKVIKSFSHFNIVSDVDRQYLLNGSSNFDFSVINHGAPIPDEVAQCDENKIFFMGSLDYEPNRDALGFFLDTIWPKLTARNPQLEFIVIGGGSIPFQYSGMKGVTFLGFVPSVFEAVKHCKALVAPIRFAGGTPSKILEAMGYGIPVITTPNGANGISGTVSDTNIVMVSESDHDAWVAAIDRVTSDMAFRNEIARNGRKLIVEHYSAPAAQEAFRTRFAKIISE